MCVPGGTAGMGFASLATQAIGGVTSAIGASYQASVQKMGLQLDSKLSGINANRDRDVARMVVDNGVQEQINERLATGQIKGQQRAAMGANNVDMTTGSALNRLVSTDAVGEANAQQIRLNAARMAQGYKTDALNYDMRSNMDKAGAGSISPFLTGTTSLLGSATNIASNWYGMSKAGVFSPVGNPNTMVTGSFGQNSGAFGNISTDYRYGTVR